MPRAETRYHQLTGVAASSVGATWTQTFILPQIAAGNTATTRTGEWITVKSLKVRFRFVFKGNNQFVRIVGVVVRDGGTSMLPSIAIDDALKSDARWDRKDWVRILFDRKIFPGRGSILPDTASSTQGVVSDRTIFKRLRLPIHFTGSAGTDEGRNTIQIYQIGQGGGTADTLEYDHDGFITWVNQV